MKHSLKTGFSFGLTSGIITTLGLIVGLYAGDGSRMIILGGILTIAVADAFSDALGIHVAEESDKANSSRSVWEATIFTFLTKFVIALTFGVPILLLPLPQAVLASIFWGLFLLIVFNYFLAKRQNKNPLKIIGEHLFIGAVVIIITNFIGSWVSNVFGA